MTVTANAIVLQGLDSPSPTALNLIVRGLLQTVSHEEAPERNPFK